MEQEAQSVEKAQADKKAHDAFLKAQTEAIRNALQVKKAHNRGKSKKGDEKIVKKRLFFDR